MPRTKTITIPGSENDAILQKRNSLCTVESSSVTPTDTIEDQLLEVLGEITANQHKYPELDGVVGVT